MQQAEDMDDDGPRQPGGRKRLRLLSSSSSSSSSSSGSDSHPPPREDCSSQDSSSSSSLIEIRHHNHHAALITDSSSDASESDWDMPPAKRTGRLPNDLLTDTSSDSDGQSDKCPICLARFRGQEVGSPDSCDHSFCYECILEWSKNVTTCPIDRKQFQEILVKRHLDGAVVRNVPVQQHTDLQLSTNDGPADATFCEVCHSSAGEDRMLLCDGCDLGYHLECLTPPLTEVPLDSWLCPECGPEDVQNTTIYVDELEVLYYGNDEVGAPTHTRRAVPLRTNNVVARTRQSERVRARIISNRRHIQVTVDQPSTSSASTTTRAAPKRKTTATKKKKSIKITYERTGREIVIKTTSSVHKKSKSKRKSTKRGRLRVRAAATRASKTKTTKRRLAAHFGICAPKLPGQTLPDVRAATSAPSIAQVRGQAGIPTLSLFGDRNAIDYFSESDANDEGDGGGGAAMLMRRRSHLASSSRRQAARKSALLPTATTTAPSLDVLGSIMDSQERMCAKNAKMSVSRDGTLVIDTGRQRRRNVVDVNDHRHATRTRTAPAYSPTDAPGNVANVNSSEDCRNQAASSSVDSVSTSTTMCGEVVASGSNIAGGSGGGGEANGGAPPSLYSDMETVSTSKAEEEQSSEEEDEEEEEEAVNLMKKGAQVEAVSSTTNLLLNPDDLPDDIRGSNNTTDDEECPNFSIYSQDTINLVANRRMDQDEVGSTLDVEREVHPDHPPELEIDGDDLDENEDDLGDVSSEAPKTDPDPDASVSFSEEGSHVEEPRKESKNDLYSDSDEEVTKADASKPFGIGDIRSLTEDISEEERSYTPCLDERGPVREGTIAGLDTEAISDDDEKDFDVKNTSDTSGSGSGVGGGGSALDALELNTKESEMGFSNNSKREDYEEGEIVVEEAKLTEIVAQPAPKDTTKTVTAAKADPPSSATFKRISKNTKERNYRDRDRSRSHSKERNKENEREKRRDRKRDKRKEVIRYNVRNLVAEPHKPTKDKFGRDVRRMSSSSRSPSFDSYSPPPARERKKPRRPRSRGRSASRSRSRSRRRSTSRKRRSFSRGKRRRSVEKKKRKSRTRSPTPRRHREWRDEAQRIAAAAAAAAAWSPSISRSRSPEAHQRHAASPSWTPPRSHEATSNQVAKPHNLTVILTNDSKKKKEKKKTERKKKEAAVEKSKKRKRDRTPPPSKEVFASGDNILVSVSFNKDDAEVVGKRPKPRDVEIHTKRTRKEREKRVRERTITPPPAPTLSSSSNKERKKKPHHDLSGVKPVAIIDLDRSPFKELTPSPKDIIELSDSDQSPEKTVACDSSQQADYAQGPKTPPEPQIKFSLAAKTPQLRQISNPLHEPDEENDGENEEIDPQDELEARLNEALHKGPNTPSEPPDSPPSSPDAYDPFDPTKSRSPTPVLSQATTTAAQKTSVDEEVSSDAVDNIPLSETPECVPKSHTPPLNPEIQPADSQSNATAASTPEAVIPEKTAASAANSGNSPIFPTPKKLAPVTTASTPTSSAVASTVHVRSGSSVNILNSTIITPVSVTAASTASTSTQQRTTSLSPMKASPTKASVKMMPKRPPSNSAAVAKNKSSDSIESNAINNQEAESPYSPGPSDYEDLFEPPIEQQPTRNASGGGGGGGGSKPSKAMSLPMPPVSKSTPSKIQNTFDNLFGSPPTNKSSKSNKAKVDAKSLSAKHAAAKIKQVGVKFDEDSLKILDDLPNSAVEMQVKDKFLKKLNRQERVVEEVKLVLKPYYNKKHVNKDEYKDILRRAVPKICHNKAGEINPKKIQNLVEAYVKKVRHSKKVSSSSSVSVQK